MQPSLRKAHWHFLFYSLLFFSSCNSLPYNVQQTLDASGKNRQELEKVITHYKAEHNTLKLQAAYFLISNLSNQYHSTGPGVNNYNKLLREVSLIPKERKKFTDQIWDSITKKLGGTFPGQVQQINDMETLTGDFLIKHIDKAFEVWQYPWTRQLGFEQFCEYILPYKLVNEQPDNWITKIQQEYKWLLDSMTGSTDLYKACLLVNRQLKKDFEINSFPYMWDVNYGQLKLMAQGKCYHATQFSAYHMRAMGIPVAMDYTPFWGNMNGGHEWDALLYKGRSIPFVGAESDPGKTKIDLAFQRKRAKVFRHTFSLQRNSLVMQAQNTDEEIPYLFKDYHMADVTKEYVPVTTVSITLKNRPPETSFAYLSVFNRQQWVPVYWGRIAGKANITFRDMGRGIVYLPVYYSSEELSPAGEPFILTSKGQLIPITTDLSKRTTVYISRKGPDGPIVEKEKEYELFFWKDKWTSMGKKKAAGDTLVYSNAPSNALFWLHSSDKISKERTFTYNSKNKKIEWW